MLEATLHQKYEQQNIRRMVPETERFTSERSARQLFDLW